MNSTISTNDDLQELATELLRLHQRQTFRVIGMSTVVGWKLCDGFFQQRKFRSIFRFDNLNEDMRRLISEEYPGKILVLYDMDVPSQNIIELFRVAQARIESKTIAIALLGGNLPAPVQEKLRDKGVVEFAAKPLTPDTLVRILTSAGIVP